MLSGLAIALGLVFIPFDFVVSGKIWGIHPGLYGLAVNIAIVLSGSLMINRSRAYHYKVQPDIPDQ